MTNQNFDSPPPDADDLRSLTQEERFEHWDQWFKSASPLDLSKFLSESFRGHRIVVDNPYYSRIEMTAKAVSFEPSENGVVVHLKVLDSARRGIVSGQDIDVLIANDKISINRDVATPSYGSIGITDGIELYALMRARVDSQLKFGTGDELSQFRLGLTRNTVPSGRDYEDDLGFHAFSRTSEN